MFVFYCPGESVASPWMVHHGVRLVEARVVQRLVVEVDRSVLKFGESTGAEVLVYGSSVDDPWCSAGHPGEAQVIRVEHHADVPVRQHVTDQRRVTMLGASAWCGSCGKYRSS